MIQRFYSNVGDSGVLEDKRRDQRKNWMWHHVNDRIVEQIKSDAFSSEIERLVEEDLNTPGSGAEEIIGHYLGRKR